MRLYGIIKKISTEDYKKRIRILIVRDIKMKENIEKRFTELLAIGQKLTNSFPYDEYGPDYWVEKRRIAKYHQWLISVTNLVNLITPANSIFIAECNRLMNDQEMKDGIPTRVVQQMYGLLNSALEEWKAGLLRKIEYIVVAETFDDFLDHATQYHKGNKKIESSVLASTVLEDTIKKIANRNGIDPKGLSLEPLIDELIKKDIFTPVKGKRVKGFASVRNHSLHAEWDKFDIQDVGELIKGTRELIDQFL